MKTKIISLLLMCASSALNVYAQEDAVPVTSEAMSELSMSVPEEKKSSLARWWQNFAHGNIDRTHERAYDLSFVFAPYYSQEGGFGIGGQASALYRLDRKDSIDQPSDFTVMGGFSVKGIYGVGLRGNINFTDHKSRLSYKANFQHKRRDFWGINYEDCYANAQNDNQGRTEYKVQTFRLETEFKRRFSGHWFWAVDLNLLYQSASLDSVHYMHGQDLKGFFTGIGGSLQYDSRDYILNAKRGIFAKAGVMCFPSALGKNPHNVWRTSLQFNSYIPVWTNGVLAFDAYGQFNESSDGDVPWQLREEICLEETRMRGYYQGCYTDNHQIALQAEIRQHLFWRIGAVAWGGCGVLFHEFNKIRKDMWLPNGGVGVRFELKHNTNARVDIGFGRGNMGIAFNFAEAF